MPTPMIEYANVEPCRGRGDSETQQENKTMATLAMIYGIIIKMNPEKNAKHHRAHIHALYSGSEAVFDVETMEKISGDFPHRQELIVRGFIAAHLDDLLANWRLLHEENGTYFRIKD